MEELFWICALLVVYPYALYPLLLIGVNRLLGRDTRRATSAYEPTVSFVLPIHNEARRVAAKIRNLLDLDYPGDKLQFLVVGDGCTDGSLAVAEEAACGKATIIALPARAGKAAALNAALEVATGEIIVFTDAAIILEPAALRRLVAHFVDAEVGCVSGEDYIEGAGTEGLYGKIELALRREEARLHSIAGASGCFYGQRRSLCEPFRAGMAPDFLSVLVTVRHGKRALAEPGARGSMAASASQKAEFNRKVRTFLRGLTALLGNAGLLNPARYPSFAFILWSHKMLRWLAPVPMLGCLTLAFLLRDQPLYLGLFAAQIGAYVLAVSGLIWPRLAAVSVLRLAAFFLLVNAAALSALVLWALGSRVEIWEPTHRPV